MIACCIFNRLLFIAAMKNLNQIGTAVCPSKIESQQKLLIIHYNGCSDITRARLGRIAYEDKVHRTTGNKED